MSNEHNRTVGEHYARIIEQIEHLVYNEDISLSDRHSALREIAKRTNEAFSSISEKLAKERGSKNGTET